MKRQILLTLSIIMLISVISFIPSNASTFPLSIETFPGQELHWTVLDYNETNNIVEPAEWVDVFYLHKGWYILNISDTVIFTVEDSSTCTGTLQIGNLTLSSIECHEIGLNLMIITGPAWPPFSNYSFDPAFISPINWATQIELANNATNERAGASINIQTSTMEVLGMSRTVISFNFTWGAQISNVTYDYATGILLYMYCKYELWYLEMAITVSGNIPSFSLYLSLFVISIVLLIFYRKRSSIILSRYSSIN